jgi:hypothetical protein
LIIYIGAWQRSVARPLPGLYLFYIIFILSSPASLFSWYRGAIPGAKLRGGLLANQEER